MKQFLIVLAFFFVHASNAQDKYLFNGDISNEIFFQDIALYTIGESFDVASLKKDFQKAFPEIPIIEKAPDAIDRNMIALNHYENAQQDFPTYDLEFMQYFATSLSDRQKQLLVKSKEAIVFSVYGLKKDTWTLGKKLNQFIHQAAKDKALIVFDMGTAEYFTPEAWNASRLSSWTEEIPYLADQITIHTYRESEFCRSITLGMQKFGLPDILINNGSCYSSESSMRLINTLAQYISHHPTIYKNQLLLDLDKIPSKVFRTKVYPELQENAVKKAILKFNEGKQEDGDPYNVLLEINFQDPAYATPQESQEQTISKLFGYTESISYAEHDDALMEASERARAKLPELSSLFNKGMDAGYSLLLKAPFETDEGGVEWMWVEVTQWNENNIEGILQNEPFHIKNLKAGATVSTKQDDIFDYLLYLPDGSSQGNETGEILKKKD